LQEQTVQPDFWSDRAKAQNVMQLLSEQRKVVDQWREVETKVTDLVELVSLAEDDASLAAEIESEIEAMSTRLDELELRAAFTSEYDARDALIAIHAGAGGTESQDWAEMLLRMYLRWAERRGFKAEVLDASPGDADHARHTSFALVEVMPEAEADADITIDPDDLKVEVFRSSGPGGQHMQKTSSAVRLTHLPTGLTVTCQSQRSQYQNKETALKILQSRLLELELEKREEERASLKGKRIAAGWGNQIRSYVLHPYKMVKDHRTDYQTSDVDAVLGGELDGLITAYLRSSLGKGND